ncbi:Der1-like family-domain-containing protein [Cryomyces antarcticus]|nr:hypothetical protein LTR60_003584 [Cryomyces antarcticus]
MDIFWAAPPVSRTLTAAVVLTSVAVYGGLLSGMRVVFYRPWLLTLFPQLWRLATPFLLTGPKLGMILDPYFLYTYGSSLETESARFIQPGDFFVYLVFVCSTILATSGFLLQGMIFLAPLTVALAYTYSQDNPTRKITFYIVTFQVKWLPYAMLAMTFVMNGPQQTMHEATGLVAAHLYDYLTRIWPTFGGGRNILWTPAFVERWFGGNRPGPRTRGFGTAFTARPRGLLALEERGVAGDREEDSVVNETSLWLSLGVDGLLAFWTVRRKDCADTTLMTEYQCTSLEAILPIKHYTPLDSR